MQSYIKILSVRVFASTPILGYARTVSGLGPDLRPRHHRPLPSRILFSCGQYLLCCFSFIDFASKLYEIRLKTRVLLVERQIFDYNYLCEQSTGTAHFGFRYQVLSYTTSQVLQLAAAIPHEECLLRLSSEDVCEKIAP